MIRDEILPAEESLKTKRESKIIARSRIFDAERVPYRLNLKKAAAELHTT